MNRNYATDAEQDPTAFLCRYRHHVRRVPTIAVRLDGPRLRKAVSYMKPWALGLHGWDLADRHSLPDMVLGWLADLLREMERLGKWLAHLAEGYTALIAKAGPPRPLNTPPTQGPVPGVPAAGGCAHRGCHCVAGILGPPGGLWLLPREDCSGWGGGDAGPLGAVSPPWMNRRGMSIHYITCFHFISKAVVLALP